MKKSLLTLSATTLAMCLAMTSCSQAVTEEAVPASLPEESVTETTVEPFEPILITEDYDGPILGVENWHIEEHAYWNSFINDDTEEKACEMTVQMSADIDVSERTFLNPYSINRYIRPFNSVRFADSDKARMIEGQLEIPYDERDFSGNRNLKIKAGSSIRITARKRTAPGVEGFYVLDKLLDTDIRDDELTSLKVQALTPGKWHIDGIGDFDVDHGEAASLILWDPSDDNTEVYVTLICDSDNPKSAALATDHLMKILGDKKSFEAKVYGAMVNRQIEENGMIETWEEGDEGNVTLTKEEFIKRLSIRNLTLDPDGSGSVMVGLDGMFTDHAYSVFVNADGTCEPNGLIG